MTETRTFTTRELAQMWNVSEATIKGWTNREVLRCYRTPGGHRRFRLEDIRHFQMQQRFEANGLLSTEDWEDPDIEFCVNEKNFRKVQKSILYLAVQNQRMRVRQFLERLYLRGMSLADLYDDILVPIAGEIKRSLEAEEMTVGETRVAGNNLEEALFAVFPSIIRRRKNGKTALCAAPDGFCRLLLNATSRILEVEGWDCLNLGSDVPFDAMTQMVEREPVNLVCIALNRKDESLCCRQFETLYDVAGSYRAPTILLGPVFAEPNYRQSFSHDAFFPNFRSFRQYVVHLER
ncbi:MAG: helix-turn-helix domain-containing protein [Acidobacteriota bacterium]